MSPGSEANSMPETAPQVGIIGDKSAAHEADHACHLSDAYGPFANRVNLTADLKDALAIDHISRDDPTSDVQRQP